MEIAYVTKGTGIHHIGRTKYPVMTGDLFVINSHTAHHYSKTRNLEICYVLLGLNMMKKLKPEFEDIPGYFEFFYVEPVFRKETNFLHHLHLEQESATDIEQLLWKIKIELEKRQNGYPMAAESLLRLFLLNVSRQYHGFCSQTLNKDEMGFKKKVIHDVIAFIEKNYEKNIKLADLARCGCLQSEYLCRVFKKNTGVTMIEYLIQIRLQKAVDKLEYSEHSITDICFDVGFNDLSYFIRTFHKAKGVSPAQYRKMTKATP